VSSIGGQWTCTGLSKEGKEFLDNEGIFYEIAPTPEIIKP